MLPIVEKTFLIVLLIALNTVTTADLTLLNADLILLITGLITPHIDANILFTLL